MVLGSGRFLHWNPMALSVKEAFHSGTFLPILPGNFGLGPLLGWRLLLLGLDRHGPEKALPLLLPLLVCRNPPAARPPAASSALRGREAVTTNRNQSGRKPMLPLAGRMMPRMVFFPCPVCTCI